MHGMYIKIKSLYGIWSKICTVSKK